MGAKLGKRGRIGWERVLSSKACTTMHGGCLIVKEAEGLLVMRNKGLGVVRQAKGRTSKSWAWMTDNGLASQQPVG